MRRSGGSRVEQVRVMFPAIGNRLTLLVADHVKDGQSPRRSGDAQPRQRERQQPTSDKNQKLGASSEDQKAGGFWSRRVSGLPEFPLAQAIR